MALACLLAVLALGVPAVAGGKGKGDGHGKRPAGASDRKSGDKRAKAQPPSRKRGGAATKGGRKPDAHGSRKARPRARASAASTGSGGDGGAKKSGSARVSDKSGADTRRSREPSSAGAAGAAGGTRDGGGKDRRRGKGDGKRSGGKGSSRPAQAPRTPPASAPTVAVPPLVAASGGPPGGAFAGAAPIDLAPGAEVPDSAAPSSQASGERLRLAPATSPVVRTVRRVVEVIPPVIWLLVAVLAAMTLLLAAGSWLLAHRGRRLERQREVLLEDVGLLQRALLPAAPEQIAGVATSVAYRPASGPGAGGVFFDVFALGDDRLGLLIGELSIGGRRALGLTALVRHTVRAYLEAGVQPRTALQLAARVLAHQLGGEQASVTTAVYDREHGTLTYAAAGHPPPVMLGTAAFEPITACASPPIGAPEPTGLRQTTVSLPRGSVVCFYTDGVVRAPVRAQPFGYRRLWLALGELGVHGDARSLLERIGAEADATRDDMAACLLRVAHHVPAAAGGGGVRRVEELEVFRGDLDTGRPVEFLAACGVPSDHIDAVIEEFRAASARLGGAVLRVLVGSGLPRAELALNRVELLPAFAPVAQRA